MQASRQGTAQPTPAEPTTLLCFTESTKRQRLFKHTVAASEVELHSSHQESLI